LLKIYGLFSSEGNNIFRARYIRDVDGEPNLVSRVIAQWEGVRPDLDVSPIGVIGRVHSIADWLTEERVSLYAKYSLGAGEFDVLAALLRSGEPYEMSPSSLADWTLVSSGAVTKRVDRCVEQGWVTRRVGQADARSRVVALTPAGKELIDVVWAASVNRVHQLVEGLEREERDQLAALLDKWGRSLGV
jgi:DNA-binding MarR family transcriptional regulator